MKTHATKRFAIALLVLAPTVAAAQSGPFGTSQGMTLDQLKRVVSDLKQSSTNKYVYTSRTGVRGAGLSNGDIYTYIVTPQHGLCKVGVSTDDIRSDSFGMRVKSEFESVSEQISAKYGQPEREFDHLTPGSIWKEGNDWMMALFKGERTLATFWRPKLGPSNVETIMAEASALSPSTAYIRFGYEFTNFDACMAQVKAVASANF